MVGTDSPDFGLSVASSLCAVGVSPNLALSVSLNLRVCGFSFLLTFSLDFVRIKAVKLFSRDLDWSGLGGGFSCVLVARSSGFSILGIFSLDLVRCKRVDLGD